MALSVLMILGGAAFGIFFLRNTAEAVLCNDGGWWHQRPTWRTEEA